MKNLRNLKEEEIATFLFINKKGNLKDINDFGSEIDMNSTILIYQDKAVTARLFVQNDNEYFILTSNWWGQIKNSYFTFEGEKGKTASKVTGFIEVASISEKKAFKNEVSINNTNKVLEISITDFNSFVAAMQRNHAKSPSYEVVEIISQIPSRVKIKITNLPKGEDAFYEGCSKKDAANEFAIKMGEKYLK